MLTYPTVLIAVLDYDLLVGAFLEVKGGTITAEILNPALEKQITELLSYLEDHDPKMRAEVQDPHTHAVSFGMRTVFQDDPAYPVAVCEELFARGLAGKIIPLSLKGIVSAVNQGDLTKEEREAFWAEVASVNEEEAKVWADLKKNRDEWEASLAEEKMVE